MNIKLILVTCPGEEKASELAELVVTNRLAACVNIVPALTSIYRWQGKIEKDKECLMILKTTDERVTELEKILLEKHPYDTPEFVVIDAGHVSAQYAAWLQNAVAADD